MSLQQAYARLLPASGMRAAELVTYLFLRRMGYTVLRTAPRGNGLLPTVLTTVYPVQAEFVRLRCSE